jgi:hypothetical protein
MRGESFPPFAGDEQRVIYVVEESGVGGVARSSGIKLADRYFV